METGTTILAVGLMLAGAAAAVPPDQPLPHVAEVEAALGNALACGDATIVAQCRTLPARRIRVRALRCTPEVPDPGEQSRAWCTFRAFMRDGKGWRPLDGRHAGLGLRRVGGKWQWIADGGARPFD